MGTQIAVVRCPGCSMPGCNCTRMAWSPLPPGMWMCMRCWNPRSAGEEREYLRERGVPPIGCLECSFCGAWAPTEAIVRSISRARASLVSEAAVPQAAVAAVITEPPVKIRQRRPLDPSKDLLSRADAARVLGVDKRTTLRRLIAEGHLPAVPGPRGIRIPRSEVERLVRDGIPPPGAPQTRPKRSRHSKPRIDDSSAIRGIKID